MAEFASVARAWALTLLGVVVVTIGIVGFNAMMIKTSGNVTTSCQDHPPTGMEHTDEVLGNISYYPPALLCTQLDGENSGRLTGPTYRTDLGEIPAAIGLMAGFGALVLGTASAAARREAAESV